MNEFCVKEVVLQGISCLNTGDRKQYDVLLAALLNKNISNDIIKEYIVEFRKMVSYISKDHETLIGVLLKLDWNHYDSEFACLFSSFLTELVSAKPYYLKSCVKRLIQQLVPKTEVFDAEFEHLKITFDYAHAALKAISILAPISLKYISEIFTNNFPYIEKSLFVIKYYILNALQLTLYMKETRLSILSLIIEKMLSIDVRIPRASLENQNEDILQFEDDDLKSSNEPSNDRVLKLDKLMMILFTFIQSSCLNDGVLVFDTANELSKDLLLVFENVILKTQQSSHVQFIIFYFASLNKHFYEEFLDCCWTILKNPNKAVIIRQASVSYIASFLARAKFVDQKIIREQMKKLSDWILRYIEHQDSNHAVAEIKKHGAFYSACQALFYVFIYNYKTIFETSNGLEFAKSLNFSRIIFSRLNPLKFCMETVVSYFARITRLYEVVFCYSIIERNNRNTLASFSFGNNNTSSDNQLEMFFPFDPYLLPKSVCFIEPIYLEWSGRTQNSSNDEDDYEDIETEASDGNNEKCLISSSFDMMCISPGFQVNNH
ncbi:RNA polymerase I-specific transcription initiation factor RRN3 [Hydra vulgaris]|uniref:RNA polymerase I-specific transcription initiation factor RRN3 n=1 Tax=Hydra vulgaris TaxID=6087 RepID=A0ABM4D8L4_HYDVU